MNDRLPAGVLDTCVVIALGRVRSDELPEHQAITTVTLGELSVGPLATDDLDERARRQAVLQAAEHHFAQSMLPYDAPAARAFGRVMAGAFRRDRPSRGRVSDFQIAAIAVANRLALYTINAADFAGIDGLDLRTVSPPAT